MKEEAKTMAEENENRVPEENREENNPAPEENNPAPVDSGRNPDELRDMINVLTTQVKQLTEELHAKDPEGSTPKADFGAYFKDFMK